MRSTTRLLLQQHLASTLQVGVATSGVPLGAVGPARTGLIASHRLTRRAAGPPQAGGRPNSASRVAPIWGARAASTVPLSKFEPEESLNARYDAMEKRLAVRRARVPAPGVPFPTPAERPFGAAYGGARARNARNGTHTTRRWCASASTGPSRSRRRWGARRSPPHTRSRTESSAHLSSPSCAAHAASCKGFQRRCPRLCISPALHFHGSRAAAVQACNRRRPHALLPGRPRWCTATWTTPRTRTSSAA